MPKHEEKRVLPYSREFLFEIISDVSKYPDFLPWCTAARVYRQRNNTFLADLIIGFKMINESWTSEVTLNPPDEIISNYVKGPMKHLENRWRLEPHAEGTLVDFVVDFEFKNPFFEKMLGPLFEEATVKMIGAFEKRAQDLSRETT